MEGGQFRMVPAIQMTTGSASFDPSKAKLATTTNQTAQEHPEAKYP